MYKQLNQQNIEKLLKKDKYEKSHTFILRLLPNNISHENKEYWHGDFQYICQGKKMIEKKYTNVGFLLNELIRRIKQITEKEKSNVN